MSSPRKSLSPLAFAVTQQNATEPPFSGEYHDFNEAGEYFCICCGLKLFASADKFYSSCGWPAFAAALERATEEKTDLSAGMDRIEILCKQCQAHLGHKFADGPYGTRYCINSVALTFSATGATQKK